MSAALKIQPSLTKEQVLELIDAETFFKRYIPNLKKRKNEHTVANCPLHEDGDPSLHINLKTGKFFCFGCGKKGDIFEFYGKLDGLNCTDNFPQIINGIAEDFGLIEPQKKRRGRKKLTPEEALTKFQTNLLGSDILQKRGISQETAEQFEIGLYEGKLIFPIRNEADELMGFKVHKGPHLRPEGTKAKSGEGVKAQLYPATWGGDKVVICEGEPDVLRLHSEDFVAVTGTTGAATWKAEWNQKFKDKEVDLVFDNDSAGEQAQGKLIRALKTIAAKLRVVEWPDDTPDGFDIGDWLQSGKSYDDLAFREIKVKKVSLEDAKTTVGKWLYFDEGEDVILDVILGTMVANRFSNVPVWMFLVGPPGAYKTETLQAVSEWPDAYPLSTLTAQALVMWSGKSGHSIKPLFSV